MKKAVIFDLDGTLTDTLDSIKISGDKTLEKFGMGPFSKEQYKYFVGEGAAKLVERCLIEGGDQKLSLFEETYEEYKKVLEEYCMYHVIPYNGITELLSDLRKKGVKTAVLSNKPHERVCDVISFIFGEECFDVILGQTEGIKRKPSPEGVFTILERLGLTADQILYLGDTGTDMQTGKAAGAFTVGALWGYREKKELLENHADAMIENPMKLLDYL
ncbi:MAG TPA: HAD family hydrolase [Lachnospiraceae bacterium]|nr:HAD family hydrolase [Lachnospiraceae bacterium]